MSFNTKYLIFSLVVIATVFWLYVMSPPDIDYLTVEAIYELWKVKKEGF